MKVAIFLSRTDQELGGAYTLENELLQEVVRTGLRGGHTLIVFGVEEIPPHNIRGTEKLKYVSIALPKKTRIEKLAGKFRNVFRRPLSRPFANKQEEFLLAQKKSAHLRTKLIENEIDIIWGYSSVYIPVSDLPYIYTVWDLQHRLQPYFPEVTANSEWEKREKYYSKLIRKASVVVTGTDVGRQEIKNFYQIPVERIRTIPLPTPTMDMEMDEGNKNILNKYNLPPNFIFYPAQFWPHKNHAGLLHAIKFLRQEYELDVPLVLAGSDRGNGEYISQVIRDLDLDDLVHKIGFVTRSELIQLYRNAITLVFVSFFGPDNIPPLEAFSVGCPVVAANVPGAQEQLGDAALLVDPREDTDIALAIKSMIEDSKLRRQLIERGHERAKQWTSKEYLDQVCAILDDLEPIRRCWGMDYVAK